MEDGRSTTPEQKAATTTTSNGQSLHTEAGAAIARPSPTASPRPGSAGGHSSSSDSQKKANWVKFEEQEPAAAVSQTHPLESASTTTTATDDAPAVLSTETVQVQIDTPKAPPRSVTPMSKTSQPAVIEIPPTTQTSSAMRTVELSTGRVREGFANGDIIVTLLPVNTQWPWITPAKFRPELVPEELMAQGLTLTVEEYVHAMETLVNDYRFTMYNICYKRVLVCWIMFAFIVLLGVLFSGLTGITLFSLGVAWLFLNAAAIFLCMWVKLRLARGLERCMARVNKQLIRHKILLALDDRGNISCHKVNLCFIYFDPTLCVKYINDFIDRNELNGTTIEPGWEARLDVSADDIVIQGSNTTRVSRKQERGLLLLLRYAHRWGNEAMRGFLDVTSVNPARHCIKYMCPCQYIERHLQCKPRGKSFNFYGFVFFFI